MTKKRAIERLFWIVTSLLIAAAVFVRILSFDRKQAESINCLSNMISIGLAARMWANDHGDRFPSTLAMLENELNTTKVLFCPGDRNHPRPKIDDWNRFDEARCSYQVVTPRIHDGDTNAVFFKCRFHGHLGYADGSVATSVGKARTTQKGVYPK